jgi:hypothetical protein
MPSKVSREKFISLIRTKSAHSILLLRHGPLLLIWMSKEVDIIINSRRKSHLAKAGSLLCSPNMSLGL